MASYDGPSQGMGGAPPAELANSNGNGYGRDRSPVPDRRGGDEFGRDGGERERERPRERERERSPYESRRDDRERSPRRRPPPPPPGRGVSLPLS